MCVFCFVILYCKECFNRSSNASARDQSSVKARVPPWVTSDGHFLKYRNWRKLREFVLEIFWEIFWEFFWRMFWRIFFDGIFLVEFFGRNIFGGFFGRIFLGGFLWEDFFLQNFSSGIFWEKCFGRIFWEDIFGRIFMGGIFWEDFFKGIQQKVIWILKELICWSRFWFLSRFCT